MGVYVKNISGWKWDSVEEFNTDLSEGNEFFGLPIDGCKTINCMYANINKNSEGEVMFYYVNYNMQLEQFLGIPTNFDINVEIMDDEL